MAVDTQNKRRSAIGLVLIPLVVAPLADGTIAAADRAHITALYAGIAIGITLVVAPALVLWTWFIEEEEKVNASYGK